MLVAISIPIFTSQLEKSRESTDLANLRSAYAEQMTALLSEETPADITVTAKQTQANWQCDSDNPTTNIGNDTYGAVTVTAKTSGGTWTVKADPSTK